LIALANLRGGQDNITVVLARIGPWVEPESAQDIPRHDSNAESNGRGSFLKRLFARKKPEPEPVEEHIYRTCSCPLGPEAIDALMDQVRKAQATAIERTWPVDWTLLTAYRRQADEAKAAGKSRSAARALGEAIVLLGTAARLHKKAASVH
jgi:protein phosphatase